MENFAYTPIPVDVDAIRIFNVEPGNFSDPVVGTLTCVAFSSKPRYIALSYTWKESYLKDIALRISLDKARISFQPYKSVSKHSKPLANVPSEFLVSTAPRLAVSLPKDQTGTSPSSLEFNNNVTITLNGSRFPVQHNLYLAIMHLRSPTHDLPLWIDAICINQEDIIERNAQVAMMSFIYTRALKVAAWLGAKEYKSKVNIRQCMSSDWEAGQVRLMASSLEDSTKLRYSLEPDQSTFARIMESAYWDRLWVVQEACLPRLLVFIYGSKIWSFEDLEHWQLLKAARSKYQLSERLQDVGNNGFEAMVRLLDTRGAKYTDAMRLENLIEKFARNGCGDSRDRVYGLLGMAIDASPFSTGEGNVDSAEKNSVSVELGDALELRRGSKAFKVDYHHSFYDIWTDVIKFAYFQAKNMEARFKNWISNAKPNFIPDSESILTGERRMSIVRTAAVVQGAFDQAVEEEVASLKFPKESIIPSPLFGQSQANETNEIKAVHESPTIRAIGYLSGKIIKLGPGYSSLVGSFRAQQDWLDCWGDYYQELADVGTLQRINEHYTAKIIDYNAKDLSRICAISSPNTFAWPISRGEKPEGPGPDFPAKLDKMQHEIHDQKQGLSKEPRICLGTDFLIAAVPSGAKVGDVIVRFWNCDAAILMRPINPPVGANSTNFSENSLFVLVGRADVAEHINSITSPGRDVVAKQSSSSNIKLTIEKGSQASGAIYVDFDLRTLQIITASTTYY